MYLYISKIPSPLNNVNTMLVLTMQIPSNQNLNKYKDNSRLETSTFFHHLKSTARSATTKQNKQQIASFYHLKNAIWM